MLCRQPSSDTICCWCRSDSQVFPFVDGNRQLLSVPTVARHIRHAHINKLLALGWYEWPFDSLIHAFKFRQHTGLADTLSSWFYRQQLLPRTQPLPDVLLPVPLSMGRYFRRHFNQTVALANALSGLTEIPVCTAWARRRHSRAQHLQSRQQRLLTTRQMYTVCPSALTKRLSDNPLRVAIVDDVITTGMTLDVLAGQVKKLFPQTQIEAWVIAVTPASG